MLDAAEDREIDEAVVPQDRFALYTVKWRGPDEANRNSRLSHSRTFPGGPMKRLAPAAAASVAMVCCLACAGQTRDVGPSFAAHAEWARTGGHAWDSVAAVALEGVMVEGAVPGRFRKIVDLRNGFSRTVQETGPMRTVTGYDGMAWVAGNGIINSIDLPSLVEDARTVAFVDRAGWRFEAGQIFGSPNGGDDAVVELCVPAGGSAVDVSFDPKTHLVTKVVVEADGGPLTTTYGDWRPVGNVKFAFRQVQESTTGEVTTLEVEQARLLQTIAADSLARPTKSSHGRLVSMEGAPVPFKYAGSHILVPVRVNDVDGSVIFDTGGANYFSPASSRRFGLEVAGGLNLSGPGESSMTGGFGRASKISLGPAELRDEVVIVAPTPWGGRSGRQEDLPDGSVGYEFLAEFRTTIDYPAETISFSQSEELPTSPGRRVTVPFYSDGHSIYVEAEVDSVRGLFRLDTGDGNTVTLFPNFAKLNKLGQDAGESASSGGGVGGKVSSRPVTLSRFVLAGAEFRGVPARLSENKAGAFASRSIAGNIGGGLLRCFRITIDYAGRALTFDSEPEHLSDCVSEPQSKSKRQ